VYCLNIMIDLYIDRSFKKPSSKEKFVNKIDMIAVSMKNSLLPSYLLLQY
jgi:hypothetical protein